MSPRGKFENHFGGCFLAGKCVALYSTFDDSLVEAVVETSGGKSLGKKLMRREALDRVRGGNAASKVATLIEEITRERVSFDFGDEHDDGEP